MITQDTLNFLKDLKQHNERPWFEENKARYKAARQNLVNLFDKLQEQLNKTDKIEGYKIWRIYRDIRFSKDKTPYKTHLSGYFKRSGAERRGSYYLSINADGTCQIGGGFYAPNKADLYRIRKEIEYNPNELQAIIDSKRFKTVFGELQGNGVKTAPRGFDKSHPAIELIRKKQFYCMQTMNKNTVLSSRFVDEALYTFTSCRPFFDYMSDVLTTNLNGESIL